MIKCLNSVSFLFLTVIIFSCNSAKRSIAPAAITFDKQGHRGARGLVPENTISAMITAIDLGVNTLEMDAVVTADRKVILSHEPFFNHQITTRANGKEVGKEEEKELNIFRMSYEETKAFDVGIKPHPGFPRQKRFAAKKPLLEDVIDSVETYTKANNRSPVYYNIETKSNPKTDDLYHPAPAEFVELIVKVLNQKGITARVTIQSFDIRTLQYLHQKYPQIKTSLLVENSNKLSLQEQLQKLGFIPNIYSPHHSMVTSEMVDECHKAGIKIIPWTVNDLPRMRTLKSFGVDGIITDYPELFKDL